MQVIYGIKNIKKPIKGSIVGIGIFDGVHKGHREIINRIVRRARRYKSTSCVVTFEPHPCRVLQHHSTPPRLISLRHRICLIGSLGVDLLVVVRFGRGFSKMAPRHFVENVLVGKLGMKEIIVGEYFKFGKDKTGDVGLLESLGHTYDYRSSAIKPIRKNGKVISSSLIRQMILKGDLKGASSLLRRPVSILGTVVRGSRRGRILGYPTANIDPHHEAIPPRGVYAVRIELDNTRLAGVLNIGFRPTFAAQKEPTIEVHIFRFNKKIYGKEIEIEFVSKLRDEAIFSDKELLIKQIKKDERHAKQVLRRSGKREC